MRAGDIRWCDFGAPRTHVQALRRPALIIANSNYHEAIPNLSIVMPITSQYRPWPQRVTIESGQRSGLAKESYIITEQPITIGLEQLGKIIGIASDKELTDSLAALRRFVSQETLS
ncbi:MAG: type II toxin-antitoxin system PemK/MazF family toxin [Mycobacteriales bacterium]